MQVFGIQLAAHVIGQYPVPEAMGIAKNIIQQLTVLAGELTSPIRDDYYSAILPSLSLLCRTFPPLCSEVTAFLVHLTKICQPVGRTSSSASKARGMKNGEGMKNGSNGDVPLVDRIENTFQEIITFVTN